MGGSIRTPLRREFDWSKTPPSLALPRLISHVQNCDEIAIEPLAGSIDPDALDSLLRSMEGWDSVRLTHGKFTVQVFGDGVVTLQRR